MIIGFTGTRFGMNEKQKDTVRYMLATLQPVMVMHGDCVGADADFHAIAKDFSIRTEIWPGYQVLDEGGTRSSPFRAFCRADLTHEPAPFLERNKNIVKYSDILIACPFDGMKKGGTWYTIRHAWRSKKKTAVIYRDGIVSLSAGFILK